MFLRYLSGNDSHSRQDLDFRSSTKIRIYEVIVKVIGKNMFEVLLIWRDKNP
jgi:hypothetical protein